MEEKFIRRSFFYKKKYGLLTQTLAGGLCEDHRPRNRFCWELHDWIDWFFLVIILNFIFTPFILIKFLKKILCLEKKFFLKERYSIFIYKL